MPAQLSARMEDYLEAILHLQQERPVARVGELAEALGVRNPTVTAALRTLAEGGFLEHESYGYIQLTPRGRRAAEAVNRRHRLLMDFFETVLGVDAARAQEDACRVEHHMSRPTVDRLARFVEFVSTCPRSGPQWLERFHGYAELEDTADWEPLPCGQQCDQGCLDEVPSAAKEAEGRAGPTTDEGKG